MGQYDKLTIEKNGLCSDPFLTLRVVILISKIPCIYFHSHAIISNITRCLFLFCIKNTTSYFQTEKKIKSTNKPRSIDEGAFS